MKKILLLGGSHYLIPVIDAVHELGAQAITCDYLPDNIAHKYSDQSYNISVADQDAVLDLGRKLKIDGILSFACDPGVLTAAYVAEKMGLPFQVPYRSAEILQDKGLFRIFLSKNSFNCPKAKRYTDREEAVKDAQFFSWPVMVKPLDSAGSKGVRRVDSPDRLEQAINDALAFSRSRGVVVEDFIRFKGCHSSTDVFTVNGELVFSCFSDQLFDTGAENHFVPTKIIWPSSMDAANQNKLTNDIQRILSLLGARTGIYNIETCVGDDGKPYVMEISPRGGGCKIAELQKMAYGVDLIKAEVMNAIGLPVEIKKASKCNGSWCEMVIHAPSGTSGSLKRISIDPAIRQKYIKLVDCFAKPGDAVRPLTSSNMSLGDIFLRFDTREELDDVTNNSDKWLRIELEPDSSPRNGAL